MSLADTLIDIVSIVPEAGPAAAGLLREQQAIDGLMVEYRHACQAEIDAAEQHCAELEARLNVYRIGAAIEQHCQPLNLSPDSVYSRLEPYCSMEDGTLCITVNGERIDFDDAIDLLREGSI